MYDTIVMNIIKGKPRVKYRRYTTEDHKFIVENLGKIHVKDIAAKLGRTTGSIQNYLFERGIKIRHSPEWYRVNPSQFHDITTPEIAYILGYLWADGHIGERCITLNIGKKDADNVWDIFKKTGDWDNYTVKRNEDHPNWQTMSSIRCCNTQLCNYLASLGHMEKSLVSPSKVLKKVPNHLKHYWWRGYFDGDGCISVTNGENSPMKIQASISGDYDQDWSSAEKLADDLYIKYRVDKSVMECGRRSQFAIVYHAGILKFLNYIYRGREEDKIGLDRKYTKYLEVKEIIYSTISKSIGYTGVSYIEERKLYVAKMIINKETKYIGFYETKEDAAKAYDREAIRQDGCYAWTNFPIEDYMPFMKDHVLDYLGQ